MREINKYFQDKKLDIELREDRIVSSVDEIILTPQEFDYFKENIINISEKKIENSIDNPDTIEIFSAIEDKYDELQLNKFIINKNKKYEVGQDVQNEVGEYLGVYLENLSDFNVEDEKEKERFKKSLLSSGPYEIARSKLSEMDRFEVYGYRKAYTDDTGSTEQILTKDVTGDLSWVNVNQENYTFEKVKQRRKQNRRKP
ncbi:MAG: hypothetical protein CL760_06490 [Chloroflexi bacterium]|nr:hypothetical protein [Chloroflexota bacterium]|tara:strand:+ start:8200 stop:8799 length:600 start_codon:yes stop_codon:yes gene_type:complete